MASAASATVGKASLKDLIFSGIIFANLDNDIKHINIPPNGITSNGSCVPEVWLLRSYYLRFWEHAVRRSCLATKND